MCGIAGLVESPPLLASEQVLRAMTRSIAHRGPDGFGTWIEGNAGLGHTRLAILDLSTAASQPMASADGRFVMSYNGEVYNFRTLRDQLSREGAQFKSSSDSEVVLEAIARWGVARAVEQFNGMFAFAVWDRTNRELFLGRDRYGIKPLYFVHQPHRFAFASEQRAFESLPQFDVELDVMSVAEYFTFQNIISDRTFTKDVHVFPPGTWARVSTAPSGISMDMHQYWDFSFGSDDPHGSIEEYSEELRRLLDQAVERQLVSDVEIGAFLSGGLDSGSIVHMAAARVTDLKTFTVGFFSDSTHVVGSEPGRDERQAAEVISAACRTSQFERVVGPWQVLDATHQLMAHLADPRVGQSYPNYFAASLASGHVKVVLAGTGGDEVLGGYPWRYPDVGLSPAEAEVWHYQRWQRLLSEPELQRLLRPMWSHLADFSGQELHARLFQAGLERSRSRDATLDAALYFEAKTFLPGLLAVDDRLSMAFGLETRVPFLDNDLVDFAMRIPASIRLSRPTANASLGPSESFPTGGKRVLRRAMSGRLPAGIVSAPKQGFSAPDEHWFNGELRPQVLEAARRLSPEVFDVNFALNRWGLAGATRIHRGLAWSLIVGEIATARVLGHGS